MKTNNKWKDLGMNHVLEGDGFWISYNPNTNSTTEGEILNLTGGIMGTMVGRDLEMDGRGETALAILKGDKTVYYILNGDFRKDYEALVPLGAKACLDFFESKPESHSGWSAYNL